MERTEVGILRKKNDRTLLFNPKKRSIYFLKMFQNILFLKSI